MSGCGEKKPAAVKPPPRMVKTIRDLIYWEYANLIARAAGFQGNYRFVVSRFKKLRSGEIKVSDITCDDRNMILKDECCVYCGSKEKLTFDHIIPLSRGGPDITSNLVLACRKCNSSKRDKDIFYWYAIERQEEIPKLVLSKYLKLVYDFHEKNGTLDRNDLNQDGKLDIMDLAIFRMKIEDATNKR
ncbi:MAG: HNH endonuclease [Desulfotomaculales bacterium]